MALEPNVRDQLDNLLERRALTGQIVLHCKRGRVMDIEVHEKLTPARPDQSVVDLREVAPRNGT